MTPVVTRAHDGPLPLLQRTPSVAWLSPTVSLVGWGSALGVSPGAGRERFRRAGDAFGAWLETVAVDDEVGGPGTGPVAFASFTFDAAAGGSVLVVPEVVLGARDGEAFVTTVGDADASPYLHPAGTAPLPADRPRYAGASAPDLAWLEAVAEAERRIRRGELDKVVLARDYEMWSREPLDVRVLLRRLTAAFPECYTFLVSGLLGASPELLIRTRGRRVESVPLAGSAHRDPDPVVDERLGKELLASPKDRREHEMAAASVGRVLGELCERLVRDPEPTLLRLANVQHLATRFQGHLMAGPDAPDVFDLLAALHPTAAVGGSPPAAALEVIAELETIDRGRYAGPVGWVDGEGNSEVAIALRCAEVTGTRARLFAGAGIVAGSRPEDELEETRLKLEAMISVLG